MTLWWNKRYGKGNVQWACRRHAYVVAIAILLTVEPSSAAKIRDNCSRARFDRLQDAITEARVYAEYNRNSVMSCRCKIGSLLWVFSTFGVYFEIERVTNTLIWSTIVMISFKRSSLIFRAKRWPTKPVKCSSTTQLWRLLELTLSPRIKGKLIGIERQLFEIMPLKYVGDMDGLYLRRLNVSLIISGSLRWRMNRTTVKASSESSLYLWCKTAHTLSSFHNSQQALLAITSFSHVFCLRRMTPSKSHMAIEPPPKQNKIPRQFRTTC